MKCRKPRIVTALAICLFSAKLLQAKEWRGIVPLKSTRADVEKLLGKPNGLGRYEFEKERAYIDYAKGCDDPKDCVCLAPKDSVIGIFVTLESELKLSELKLDLNKFKRKPSSHLPGIVTYSNDEEGVAYIVDDKDGEVINITYRAAAKDCRRLIDRAGTNKRKSKRLSTSRSCNERRPQSPASHHVRSLEDVVDVHAEDEGAAWFVQAARGVEGVAGGEVDVYEAETQARADAVAKAVCVGQIIDAQARGVEHDDRTDGDEVCFAEEDAEYATDV